jgi:hypothetical protein
MESLKLAGSASAETAKAKFSMMKNAFKRLGNSNGGSKKASSEKAVLAGAWDSAKVANPDTPVAADAAGVVATPEQEKADDTFRRDQQQGRTVMGELEGMIGGGGW